VRDDRIVESGGVGVRYGCDLVDGMIEDLYLFLQ
jgi:hypothetical protein